MSHMLKEKWTHISLLDLNTMAARVLMLCIIWAMVKYVYMCHHNCQVTLEDIPHIKKNVFGQQSSLLPSCILVHFQAAAARAWSTVISSAVALIDKNLLRL